MAQTGHNASYVWNEYSYAVGLQHYQNWWIEYNAKRQLQASAMGGKLPEIVVFPIIDSEDNLGSKKNTLIV